MVVMDLEQKRQYGGVAFVVTSLLYLGVGVVWWSLYERHLVADRMLKAERVVSLQLSSFVPVAPQQATPPPSSQTETPKKSAPLAPTRVQKSTPPPKPLVKPLPSKGVTHKHIAHKPLHPTRHKHPKPKYRTSKHHTPKHRTAHKPTSHTKQSAKATRHAPTIAQKNRFLSEVRRRIEAHKHYPRIAKRRGIEGVVKVRFTILPGGKVGHILLSGSKLFYASARKAIEGAFPIDLKGVPIELPTTVSLRLRYQLR